MKKQKQKEQKPPKTPAQIAEWILINDNVRIEQLTIREWVFVTQIDNALTGKMKISEKNEKNEKKLMEIYERVKK